MEQIIRYKNLLIKRIPNLAILFLCLGFLLSSCEMKSEEKKVAQEAQESVNSSNLESFVKVDIKEAEAEKYIIHFSWPVIEDGKIIRLRLNNVLAEVLPSQTFFTHQVSHNQRLKYYIDILDQTKTVQQTFSREVIVPRDFVVTESQNSFTEPTDIYINRLYLSTAIPLQTFGNNVSIFTNEIHSAGGIIRTFPEGARTERSDKVASVEEGKEIFRASSGRGGGNITIKTSRLIGELIIELRGEDAADGKDGVYNPNRATDGAPGTIGDQRCMDMGDGYEVCDCHRPGSNGGNGANGAKGENGWYGGDGGSTGSATVFIQTYIPATSTDPAYPNEKRTPVSVLKFPGQPGKKGLGAAGQPGGNRGEVPSSPYQCPGTPGNAGSTGEKGDDGKDGLLGAIEESCIYVGTENINECFK